MFYLYVLRQPEQDRLYLGCTENLGRKLIMHKTRRGASELVYYEVYQTASLAQKREAELKKQGSAWRRLKKRIGMDSHCA